MQKILFINRSYWPDVEATGQLLTELCEDLAGQFDVSVLCGQPNRNPENAGFKRSGTEIRKNVTIRRVRHTQFEKKRGLLFRAANMLTFFIRAAPAAVFGRCPDTVVVETDPPLLCFIGYLVQRLRGVKLVLYQQDIYPEVAKALKKIPDWFPYRIVRRFFYFVYRRADRIVVLSADMKAHLEANGVDVSRIHVIPNWTDPKAVFPIKERNEFRDSAELNGQFVVMYSGNIGLSQRLETVLDAAECLKDNSNITFVFVGDGASREQFEDDAKRRGLCNVRFFDYQPKAKLAHSLSAADLHLVLLEPALVPLLMPSKIYSVLASGTPCVVLSSQDCELSNIVMENEVGTVCEPHDSEELVRQILMFAEDPDLVKMAGSTARELAVSVYCRENSVAEFAAMISLLSKSDTIESTVV